MAEIILEPSWPSLKVEVRIVKVMNTIAMTSTADFIINGTQEIPSCVGVPQA